MAVQTDRRATSNDLESKLESSRRKTHVHAAYLVVHQEHDHRQHLVTVAPVLFRDELRQSRQSFRVQVERSLSRLQATVLQVRAGDGVDGVQQGRALVRHRKDQLLKSVPAILFEDQEVAEDVAEVIQQMPPAVVGGELGEGRGAEVVRRATRARGHHRQLGVGAAGSARNAGEHVPIAAEVLLEVLLREAIQRIHLQRFDVGDLGRRFAEPFQRIEGWQRRADVEQGVAAAARGRVREDGVCAVRLPVLRYRRQGRGGRARHDRRTGAGILP